MPSRAKRRALQFLSRTGALAAWRVVERRRAVILTYHGVLSGDDDRYDYLNNNFVAASAFDAQMAFVRSHYTPVALPELVTRLRNGLPLPDHAASVTFDDGFANNYRVALPILQRHGIQATIFVASGHLGVPAAQLWTERAKRAICLSGQEAVELELPGNGSIVLDLSTSAGRIRAARTVLGRMKRLAPDARDRVLAAIELACGRPPLTSADRERYDFLTWDEARALVAAGMHIGSHTVSHPILTTLRPESLVEELVDSKRRIEQELSVPCLTFAYPNGSAEDYGPREARALEHAGYHAAFALRGGLVRPGDAMYALDRVNVSREFTGPLFEATLSGALDRVRRLTRRDGPGYA